MNAKLRRQAAARRAEEVIEESGVVALPVDPLAIAEAQGILVHDKAALDGVSGFLMKRGDDFGICVATHIKNEGFRRFSVSHELGHYFLDGHPEHLFRMGDGAHASQSGFTSGDPFELDADEFAANLLMPKMLFGRALREAGRGFKAIQHLADLCKTSITSTAIRYAMRADESVAVIVSSGAHIEYCFMSDRLKSLPKIEWPRRGQGLPRMSHTARFNAVPERVARGECLEATAMLDEWIDGAPEVEVCEDIVGLGSYGRTLTVLHTDEAVDLDDDDD